MGLAPRIVDSAGFDARTGVGFQRLAAAAVWHPHCSTDDGAENIMLRISLVESPAQRVLVLEGRLIGPWIAELRTVWNRAKAQLYGRELVIDMEHVMVISQEAENTLLQMMNEGARFLSRGVLAKHVLQHLRQRSENQDRIRLRA
jgi:hypothetical protein